MATTAMVVLHFRFQYLKEFTEVIKRVFENLLLLSFFLSFSFLIFMLIQVLHLYIKLFTLHRDHLFIRLIVVIPKLELHQHI